jgi:polysaccharide biosynthesis protein PslG
MRRLRSLLALLCAGLLAVLVVVVVALGASGSAEEGDGAAPVAPVLAGAHGISAGSGFQALDDEDLTRTLDDLVELGVRWVRFDFDWSLMEPDGPEAIDWAPWDRVVTAVGLRGIRILGIVDYTPGWACGCHDPKTPPTHPADFARFAGAVAARYGPMGVHHWEIWNEPNLSVFWHPAPDAAAYAALLEAAAPAIRAQDPAAFIVSGGLAPAPDDGTEIAPVTFLQALYAHGAGPSFDAVGHHPYTYPADITVQEPWSAWHQMAGTEVSLRSVMAANGDEAKRIWMTEFGAPTGGDPKTQVSEAAQALLVGEAYAAAAALPWAGPLFWYSYRDRGTAPDDRENFFGLVANDYARKPAFDVYRTSAVG